MRAIVASILLVILATTAFAQVIGGRPKLQPTQGDFVFVAKIADAQPIAQTNSMPPSVLYAITFEELEMIKGEKPEMMVLNHSVRGQAPEFLSAGSRVVVRASAGRVTSIEAATDDTIKAAGGKVAPAAKPATGAATTPAPQAAWINLYADEPWYQAQDDAPEQIFSGILQAVPQTNEKNTLMRTSLYTLAGRTLYTGAARHPALDKLVGQKVEIKGKPVDMRLEGRKLSELWPAAVRPAAEK